jgi:plasmid maintenance system killer protein
MNVLLKGRAEITLRSLDQHERQRVHVALHALESTVPGELIRSRPWNIHVLKLASSEQFYSFRVSKTLRLVLSARSSQWIVEDIVHQDRLAEFLRTRELR